MIATQMTIALLNAGLLKNEQVVQQGSTFKETISIQPTEEQVKTKLRELITFYKILYENPGEVNPSSSEFPL